MPAEVLLLPDLNSYAASRPAPAAPKGADESLKDQARSAPASHRGSPGVVYQGPQPIVSNPPHPDNIVQTIQLPDIPEAPKLPKPVFVRSMVAIAPAKPEIVAPPKPQIAELPKDLIQDTRAPQVALVQPIALPPEQPKVEAPKLPLQASEAPLHAVANASAPVAMPKFARSVPLATSGNDAQNVLIINALPGSERAPAAIPSGVLSGAFTVSPSPVGSRPGTARLAGGGVDVNGTPGPGTGNGNGPAGTGTTAGVGTGGTGTSPTGSPDANGTRAGAGSGAGSGRGGTGSNPNGNGTGNGTHLAAGRAGAGTGGNSPFAGITIQGGSSSNRVVARTPATSNPKPQASYGITIVASGASGGGFKDFGVFRDEASYTVYLDMADTGLSISTWTLQYALYSHRLPSATAQHVAVQHGALTPPYAVTKPLPRYSPEQARRASAGGTIVVFGIINLQGKFEELKVMQSPDPALNQLLLDSLARWTLRPAEMNGAQVPVKFLLGVPVNSIPGA